eukprot:TRINITY_DN7762_c0_g3_i1.p1 TRINITY_DN7762_c0_g3~~TRINITY_DN7762_c0_g3_i1.p1  ORF type:complete len:386 (+),score=98.36 TRINITY_DN7762_c0_g3_i1:70-1227(+)
MAMFWRTLREELRATVDDIREKGAVGAVRDAALDTRDIAKNAGGWVLTGIRNIVDADEIPQDDDDVAGATGDVNPGVDGADVGSEDVAPIVGPVVRACLDRKVGDRATLHFHDSSTAEVEILGIDDVSEPPRARVRRFDSNDVLVAVILSKEDPRQPTEIHEGGLIGGARATATAARATVVAAAVDVGASAAAVGGDLFEKLRGDGRGEAAANASTTVAAVAVSAKVAVVNVGGDLLGKLRGGVQNTIEDFRDKGAVGALRDATLDVVDIASDMAGVVRSGAESVVAGVRGDSTGDSGGGVVATVLGSVTGDGAATSANTSTGPQVAAKEDGPLFAPTTSPTTISAPGETPTTREASAGVQDISANTEAEIRDHYGRAMEEELID